MIQFGSTDIYRAPGDVEINNTCSCLQGAYNLIGKDRYNSHQFSIGERPLLTVWGHKGKEILAPNGELKVRNWTR